MYEESVNGLLGCHVDLSLYPGRDGDLYILIYLSG